MFVLITFIFSLLFFRLSFLQVFSSERLQNLAEEQWTRELPINAERGTIYDRNGVVLAISYTTYDVYVRSSNVSDPEYVTNFLCSLLNLNHEKVLKKVSNKKVSESLIKLQIEKDIAKKIKQANISGVYLSENTKRFYPYGDLLTQILGYTTIDNIGQSGLELYYDKYLKGIEGYSSVQSDIIGTELDNTLANFIPAISGCDLTLTIDYKIQQFAEKYATEIMQNEKPKTATIIVMQPQTGEILAMTSKPSFDLNNPPREDIESLNAQTKNLSVVDVYEPGSTFKVLTTAIALEEKLTSLTEGFYDPGYRIVDGEKIKCWRLHGHGSQTLVDGLNNSCNSVFVDLALRIGTNKFYTYLEKYGFGNLTNVDFPGESSGILMNQDNVKRVDLARIGFGQAIAVTPLQQITAISSVLNGGTRYKPYFVKSINNDYNNSIKQFSPMATNRTISEKTSENIRYMFTQVIEKASGINAFIPGYSIGGKTGTSQKYEDGKINGEYTSSFVGAFPMENPEYVVLVIVDEPSGASYYGSIVATPYAKKIFQDIIEYKNIQPTRDVEKDKLALQENIEMPNLVGLSLAKAVSKVSSLGLQYEIQGEGNKIVGQLPTPTTMMFKNGIVVLKT